MLGPGNQHTQLHTAVNFGQIQADHSVPQGQEDGPAKTEAAAAEKAAPKICPLCKSGGDELLSPQADRSPDLATQSSSEQEAKKPLQRRKRTMSRKRSW